MPLAADGAGSDYPAHRNPLTELTQNMPNKGKLNKEFNATELHPRPRIQVPHGPASVTMPQASRAQARRRPCPSRPRLRPAVKDVPKTELPKCRRRRFSPWKPPSWRSKPPAGPPPAVPPGQAVWPCRTLRSLGHSPDRSWRFRGRTGGGRLRPRHQSSPSPGSQGSKHATAHRPARRGFSAPNLIRILASVKQHWLSVMPESVRLGRSGKVAHSVFHQPATAGVSQAGHRRSLRRRSSGPRRGGRHQRLRPIPPAPRRIQRRPQSCCK